MAESPSKRQRLSADVYKERGGRNVDDNDTLPVPTTPSRRASYLSPTKASLARSHPNILAKSPKRGSLTEPRGKLLRQELLGTRTNTKGSASITKTNPRLSRFVPSSQPQTVVEDQSEKDGFAQAIAQSFPPPPQALDHVSENDSTRAVRRSPLRTRQAPNPELSYNARSEKAQSPVLNDIPVPKLVRRQEPSITQERSETPNETDIQPTPVQLGIGAAPDRPRGLASSSSLGSKSGSGRHRRRVRKEGGAITSSPLKPKNRRSVSPTDFSDVEEAEIVMAEEAAESDVEDSNVPTQNRATETDQNRDVNDLPPVLEAKQAELDQLRLELEMLKTDLAKIESLADQLQNDNDLAVDDGTIELLKAESYSRAQSLQNPDTNPLLVQNPSTYLDLFAPGNLQLERKTSTKTVQKRLKTLHSLTVKPPKPYMPNTLQLSFDIQIDAEDSSIDKVILKRSNKYNEYGNLLTWIESRLHNPLHMLDIGGLIWGSGQYFEACVSRAKALRHLDKVYNQMDSVEDIPHLETDLSKADILELSRYFHQTELLLSPPEVEAPSVQASSPSDPNCRQVLLSYEIKLSWTGDVTTHIDISLKGMSIKAQQGTKELFARLLPSGVVEAFRGVGHVLRWDYL